MNRIILSCLLLSACATQSQMNLIQAEQNCSSLPFIGLGQCIEHEFDQYYPGWHSHPESDLSSLYIAWVKAAGDRVADHTMTEADARLGAATLLTRLREMAMQRRALAESERQAGFATALSGLALMQASGPHPASGITCQTVDTGLGTTRTTCQ